MPFKFAACVRRGCGAAIAEFLWEGIISIGCFYKAIDNDVPERFMPRALNKGRVLSLGLLKSFFAIFIRCDLDRMCCLYSNNFFCNSLLLLFFL